MSPIVEIQGILNKAHLLSVPFFIIHYSLVGL